MALEYSTDALVVEVDSALNETLREVGEFVLLLFRALKENTPIDTGFAFTRWQIKGTGNGDFDIKPVDPEQGFENIAEEASVASLEAALGEYRRLRNTGFGELIVIFNDASYISFLDQGSSDQAPNGIVDVSLAQVNEI